jgi:branched-chain amino acid transport system ATP-binding protein
LQLLEVNNLSVRFGGIVALDGVNLSITKGSITGLIGPNGAGKTTVFNCITGFYRASAGSVLLQDENKKTDLVAILGKKLTTTDCASPLRLASAIYYKMFGGSFLVAQAGVARTFQNIRLFKDMTVLENLLVAQHAQLNRNVLAGLLGTKKFRNSEQRALELSHEWLDEVGLGDDWNRLAGELPYGKQRQLEIARAMCTRPKLVCLDEPAAGLNPLETQQMARLIQRLRDRHNVTVFVIEHDMQLVMGICDQIAVLNYGKIIATGKPSAIQQDPAVLAAYLGTEVQSHG